MSANVELRGVPLERRVGLTTQSGNISMTTVLAEGDAMALCARECAAGCSAVRGRCRAERCPKHEQRQAAAAVSEGDGVSGCAPG